MAVTTFTWNYLKFQCFTSVPVGETLVIGSNFQALIQIRDNDGKLQMSFSDEYVKITEANFTNILH